MIVPVCLSEKSAVISLMLRYRECSSIRRSQHVLYSLHITLRHNVSEVDHAGHAYSSVGRFLPASRIISSTGTYHVRLLVTVMSSIFVSVTR